ncbi:MAG TPA: T9SS type A sorting domain-containing protein, partial [Saprospiraceae bacterium]|nr:T9SS type A sorting domain-containing protein [Saprospiraceae bacterium]
ADLLSTKRNYLDNTYAPPSTSITTPTDMLIAPINGAPAVYNNVILEWKPVVGATYYLVEVDLTSSFGSPQLQGFVVSGTTQTITNLLNNKKYYWRVRPFNEYVTCASPRTGIFNTATTSTENIEGLTAMQVSPNPVSEGESARLTISTETGFEAQVRMWDASGRVLYAQQGLNFPQGNTTLELPLTGLRNGVYFVALQTNQGQAVRKVTVLR